MIHRPSDHRRTLAALFLLPLASCAWIGGGRRNGSEGPALPEPTSVAAAPKGVPSSAPVSTPSSAPSSAPAPARAPDPAAPIAIADYPTRIAERRQTLIDRGLRLGAADVGYYMDVQEARLRQLGGSSLRLTRSEQSLILELPGPLTFEVGSARLSDSARSALTGVARVLVDYRFTLISVDGHTDDSGDPAQNRSLSEQRASAVAKHLIAEGVEPQRLIVVGRGSDRPMADNGTEIGREANRRVVLRIDPLRR